MKKPSELPQAVNNLRAIWDKKKVEMEFTQVEAAKELGWSQGAISHYLNDITDLGPAAVVKFANFLGVDPLDIDPNVAPFLPNIQTVNATKFASNLNKTTATKIHHTKSKTSQGIILDHTTLICAGSACDPLVNLPHNTNETVVINVCAEKEAPNSSWWLIQKKNEKAGHIYYYTELPPKAQIKNKYAITSTSWITKNRLRG